MINILVLEDDIKLNQLVSSYLNKNGYLATGCLNVSEAYSKMDEIKFSMIISDIMMPGIDGFEFADSVREMDSSIPILFMSARDDMVSKEKGFQIGIDDYMVKPIDMGELLLRVKALLRRANIKMNAQLTIGSFTMNTEERTVYLDSEEVILTMREFDLLYKLLSYPKKTFTRAQLLDELWGLDSPSGPRAVDVYITKLRDKFSDCNDFEILTVHGLGYKAVVK